MQAEQRVTPSVHSQAASESAMPQSGQRDSWPSIRRPVHWTQVRKNGVSEPSPRRCASVLARLFWYTFFRPGWERETPCQSAPQPSGGTKKTPRRIVATLSLDAAAECFHSTRSGIFRGPEPPRLLFSKNPNARPAIGVCRLYAYAQPGVKPP